MIRGEVEVEKERLEENRGFAKEVAGEGEDDGGEEDSGRSAAVGGAVMEVLMVCMECVYEGAA